MALNNYLEDDWGDNALSGRSNDEKDVYYQYGTGGVGRLLKGVYRPRWTTKNGSPSASNQKLQLPKGNSTNQRVVTPSQFTTGEWSVDVAMGGSPSAGAVSWVIFAAAITSTSNGEVNDGYEVVFSNSDELRLFAVDGGSFTQIISSADSTSDDGSTHTWKTTRNSYGKWELFKDGTSQGTATDTTHSDCEYVWFNNELDVSVDFDNLSVL